MNGADASEVAVPAPKTSVRPVANPIPPELKSIFLLADSQALLASDHANPVTGMIRAAIGGTAATAAYIGAANGDDPAYFSIFEGAADLIGIGERRMVRATFPPNERAFLETADLILLAGGSADRAWRAFENANVVPVIRDRYYAGAVLVGVSAGATLLGRAAMLDEGAAGDDESAAGSFDAFCVVPWIIDSHDDARGWRRLRRQVEMLRADGIGLPPGSGVVCHPDLTLEAIRRPVTHFRVGEDDGGLILPLSSAVNPPLANPHENLLT